MDDTYGDAAHFEGSQATAEVEAEATPKVVKQAPQKGVDEFWEKFTTKYPGKVHNILPKNVYAKTKALHSPKGVVSGQRAIKSYDEAAKECKNAIDKIVQECRRVNHRYRDPHFDIEFDLKQGQRDCLDGFQPLKDDGKAWPRSVKRVTDIFEDPQFFQDDASASDVRQGRSGDCWFLAALCAISNKKHLIDTLCVARDEKVGVYGFVFHRDGEFFHTVIDDKLYLIASDWWESTDNEKRTFEAVNRQEAEERYRKATQTGSQSLYFAQCREENETWLPLLEKAYAKAHGDFSAIDGGFTGEGIEDLTGGVTTELYTTDILDKDKFWKDEIMKVNDEFLFGCATGRFDKWQDSDVASYAGARGGVIRMHAYSIMDAVEVKGHRLLKIRNPWGTDEWRGAWSDGSEQWTAEWLQLLDHKFGDDGMFWISYKDLLRRYSSFDRTRLFGKDWAITQQWTTVNVPYSADYNDTAFTLTLIKRSPVVIVLSQLDNRYFKGLEGQYWFQLHFRLDKDGVDDYIVRSHGNYSMTRSVSTDLELDPGTYTVLMKITATRYESDATPEEVIRKNCKTRQNKLIQVGLAYDLGHAKGEIRETEEEKQQQQKQEEKKKAAEKKKAREDTRAKKLKEWEYNKKLKSRERRQAKRKEESQRKKAEKQKAAEGSGSGEAATAPANPSTTAPATEGEGEKQATAGATETKPDSTTADAAKITPAPPSDPQPPEHPTTTTDTAAPEPETKALPNAPAAEQPKPTDAPPADDPPSEPSNPTATKSTQSTTPLPPTPTITLNNNLPPPSPAPEDDPSYDSDASFPSSIDTLLDLPPCSPTTSPSSPNYPPSASTADDSANQAFENDPWNAVCVVGLRVYSKDEGCAVQVVRPRQEEDDDTGLDLDDASKGVSGEREGGV